MNDEYHWICNICGKEFETRRKLNKHRKESNHYFRKPKQYQWKCNECGEVFRTRQLLNIHKREFNHLGKRRIKDWICKCGKVFDRRWKLDEHKKLCDSYHLSINNNIIPKVRNYKNDDVVCEFCGKEFKNNGSKKLHLRYCRSNPNYIPIKRKTLTEEQKLHVSECMKKAHAEGSAHKLGHYTVKGRDKSYPEEWFINVIENEFNDKDYKYNFQVHRFRLDFAWPKKMRYIEIDGDQHYRFQSVINKDKRRAKFLKDLGWTELRLSWSFISKNKQECIQAAKSFIDDVSDLPEELLSRDKRIDKFNKNDDRNPDKINSTGRYNPRKLTKDDLNKVLKSISESGIDITKFGWKNKLCKFMQISKRRIDRIVHIFPEEFEIAYR